MSIRLLERLRRFLARKRDEYSWVIIMVEEIKHENKILALIIRKNQCCEEGTHFFTEKESSLQLGILNYKKRNTTKPHKHEKNRRETTGMQEVFNVQCGKIQINFYNDSGEKINEAVLNEGDTILLVSGGHGIKTLEDSRIVIVKQGPYQSDDKKFF